MKNDVLTNMRNALVELIRRDEEFAIKLARAEAQAAQNAGNPAYDEILESYKKLREQMQTRKERIRQAIVDVEHTSVSNDMIAFLNRLDEIELTDWQRFVLYVKQTKDRVKDRLVRLYKRIVSTPS